MPGVGSRRRNVKRRKRAKAVGNGGDRSVGIEAPVEVKSEQQSIRLKELLVKEKLDELYRVKAELASTKRRLQRRSSKMEDLRSQLEASEHRLSTEKLQRELYKAEAEISKKNLDSFLAKQWEYSNAENPVSSNQGSPNVSPTTPRHRHFKLFGSKSRSSDRSSNHIRSKSISRELPSFFLKKNSGHNGEHTNSPEVDRLIDKVDRLSMVHRYHKNSVNSVQKHIVDQNNVERPERQTSMTPNKSVTNQDRSPEVSSKENEYYQSMKNDMYLHQIQAQVSSTLSSSLHVSDLGPSFC
eukprot:CAMPEP_0195283540 /NCGR_PEP_ID=MMETSP0707-20130614/2057_1 /TAXON_ID=33640 /ORGANISM="Asterionellopsis glacialis, Strain CCMP134" /LENGTH=296 /DNA_ID=CAMNT_0040342725 /DNA_START=75 /DNA_END=965 /DNA_ORIENTATION=+